MENLMPGEVGIPHGSWVRVNEETGIDEGGADNYLTGNDISGGGVTSYNNNNCNFEKYDGPAFEARLRRRSPAHPRSWLRGNHGCWFLPSI